MICDISSLNQVVAQTLIQFNFFTNKVSSEDGMTFLAQMQLFSCFYACDLLGRILLSFFIIMVLLPVTYIFSAHVGALVFALRFQVIGPCSLTRLLGYF